MPTQNSEEPLLMMVRGGSEGRKEGMRIWEREPAPAPKKSI